LIIYTESDYLEAHLTEISAETHNWPVHIDAVPQLLSDAFKRFTAATADTRRPAAKSRQPKSSSR
jgi:hypothetical protein